jgi:hypothetical protein
MITSLISTALGGIFAGVQNHFEHKQDVKKEISLAEIQANKEIEMSKQGVIISENELQKQRSESEQEAFKTQASIKQSDTEEYKAFANAVTQTSAIWQDSSKLAQFANFIIVTTRPLVTYFLLILVGIITVKIIKYNDIPENHLEVFDLILAEFSAVMSYWFVRRSFEKRQMPNLQLQKKN